MKIGITQTPKLEKASIKLSEAFKEQELISSIVDIQTMNFESDLADIEALILLINKDVFKSISREKWQFLIDLNQKETIKVLTVQIGESAWTYSPFADKIKTFPLNKSLLNNDNFDKTVSEIRNYLNGSSQLQKAETNIDSTQKKSFDSINPAVSFDDNNRQLQRVDKLKQEIATAKRDKKWSEAIRLSQELIAISKSDKKVYEAELKVLEEKNKAIQLIEKGRKLFKKGNFEQALVLFEKAYEIHPTEKLQQSILKIKSKQRHQKVDKKVEKAQRTKLYILLGTIAFAAIVGIIVYITNQPEPIKEIEVIEADVPDYEMVLVDGGTFSMGTKGEADREPVHQVSLTPFYIGKYEVTVEQFDLYCQQQNIDFFKVPFDRGKLPMTNVSWINALEYANWLSRKDGYSAVYIIVDEYEVIIDEKADGYRLPTESQWEFAARGGNSSQKYLYSGGNYINKISWYSENSRNRSKEVGTKQPNELGIHDMSGNVWEWCWDWYGERAYGYHEKINPQGMKSGNYKCVRGGSWYTPDYYLQPKYRSTAMPLSRDPDLGFRLVRMK